MKSKVYDAIIGGDIRGGDGLVTIGHQVLFIRGSLKLMLNIPPLSENDLMDLPVYGENTGPDDKRVDIQFMLAVFI